MTLISIDIWWRLTFQCNQTLKLYPVQAVTQLGKKNECTANQKLEQLRMLIKISLDSFVRWVFTFLGKKIVEWTSTYRLSFLPTSPHKTLRPKGSLVIFPHDNRDLTCEKKLKCDKKWTPSTSDVKVLFWRLSRFICFDVKMDRDAKWLGYFNHYPL